MSHIDIEATKRALGGRVIVTKIEFKIIGDRQACVTVKEALQTLFQNQDFHIRSKKPLAVVEVSPEMKPVIAQGGRMLGYLERKGLVHLKPEWGFNLRIYYAPKDERPSLLAEYCEKNGWSIQEGNLSRAMPGLTAADALAAVQQ